MNYKKTAICISGNVDYALKTLSTYNTYFFHYGELDADVFIHTWVTNDNQETIEKVKSLYKPTKILIESNQFECENESTLYSMMMSNELKKDYENENGFNYEMVIKHSFNVMFRKDKFLTPTVEDRHLYYLTEDFGENNKNYEHHGISNTCFWGDSQTMDIVMDTYYYYKYYVKSYKTLVDSGFIIDYDMSEFTSSVEQTLYTNAIKKNIHPICINDRINVQTPNIINTIEDVDNVVPKIKHLLATGDSWTYGSEIRDPNLSKEIKDWDKENDEYRIERIFPTKLGKLMGVEEVTNLSYPAVSNDRIVRCTINWITKEYLSINKDTSQLFVIVGLTSPQRKDFVYEDDKTDPGWQTVWPMWKHEYGTDGMNDFADLYAVHLNNKEEYVSRYVNQIYQLECFFKIHKIKYLIFQGFYQHQNEGIRRWSDYFHIDELNYSKYVNNYDQNENLIWNMVDDVRFVDKVKKTHSFHNYVVGREIKEEREDGMDYMHPTEIGHTWWSEYLFDYIKKYDLMDIDSNVKIKYNII